MFEKNFAAIYLTTNKIIFAYPEEEIFEQLDLDATMIHHLEIKNGEKLVQVVKNFLEQFPDITVVIFLAKQVVFEREVGFDESGHAVGSSFDQFISMVPITEDKLGTKILESEHTTLYLAANREYYESVKKGAELAGIKVSAVVPAFLFADLESAKGLTAESVSSAINNSKLLHDTNFLDQKKGEVPEIEKSAAALILSTESRSRTRRLILTIVLIGLLTFSLVFSYMNGLFDRFFTRDSSEISNVTEEVTDLTIATQSASPLVSPVTMSDLRALVRNGTGESGQAMRTKELLDELQLEEVVIATGSGQNTTTTLLQYDPLLPDNLVQEVKHKLEELFASVDDNEATNTGEFEFLITTGEEIAD